MVLTEDAGVTGGDRHGAHFFTQCMNISELICMGNMH